MTCRPHLKLYIGGEPQPSIEEKIAAVCDMVVTTDCYIEDDDNECACGYPMVMHPWVDFASDDPRFPDG